MEKVLTSGRTQIENSVTRLGVYRGVEAGRTIRVAFLDSAPDYSTESLDGYWIKYFSQIPRDSGEIWFNRISDEYKTAKAIQTTFQPVAQALRLALFESAIERWETVSNVDFLLVNDPGTADVRGSSSFPMELDFTPASPYDGGGTLVAACVAGVMQSGWIGS